MPTIEHTKARNSFHARHVTQRYYDGEEYFMQIDSHMRFEPHWDTRAIKMLHNCDSGKKSVITVFPRGYNLIDPNDLTKYTVD